MRSWSATIPPDMKLVASAVQMSAIRHTICVINGQPEVCLCPQFTPNTVGLLLKIAANAYLPCHETNGIANGSTVDLLGVAQQCACSCIFRLWYALMQNN
jgi:hypothetical protein